jgi:methyltransferase (TIGR00027 family)
VSTLARLFAAATTLLCVSPALAVQEGAASTTAALVCNFRAVGALHPDQRLRNGDSLAAKFCNPRLLPFDYPLARATIDLDPEGYSGYFFVNSRTRHIDEQLIKAAAQGIRQIVILGAGYDSRAYRFHKRYPRLRFFELDFPETGRAKQAAVKRVLGKLPAHVRYVPIDFDQQTLESVLPAAGYDAKRKSLFIIEGVLMYVNEAGNRATLDFIGKHSPAGSKAVYDYVLRDVIDGKFEGFFAAYRTANAVARLGEPFVTGWTPAEAAEFARASGLEVEEDLDPAELTRRYLTSSSGKIDGRTTNWQRIIDALVR